MSKSSKPLHRLLFFPTSATGQALLRLAMWGYLLFWVTAVAVGTYEFAFHPPWFTQNGFHTQSTWACWLGIDKYRFNLWAEVLALPVALVGCLLFGKLLRPVCRGVGRLAARVAGHRRSTVLLLGLVVLAASAAISWRVPPEPVVHDEFSHLLVAETLAAGHVAMPTHPHWHHFETFFYIHEPRMFSLEPPGLGAIMALGIWALDAPIAGVWLSTALAVAALCWMLQGWLPPRYALWGGVFAAMNSHLMLTWGQSFWGGALTMASGAIVAGALVRLWVRPTVGLSVAMSVALVVLANVRPFEGLVFSLPIAAALLVRMAMAKRAERLDYFVRLCLPAAAVLAVGAVLMAEYNLATTGDALQASRVPYDQQYIPYSHFFGGASHPIPSYRHAMFDRLLGDFYGSIYDYQQTLTGYLSFRGLMQGAAICYSIAGLSLLPVVLAMFGALRSRGAGFALSCLMISIMTSLATVPFFTHYTAAAYPWFVLLLIQGWRRLRQVRWGRYRWGRLLSGACAWVYVASFAAALVFHLQAERRGLSVERPKVIAQLEALPGNHLVFVEYQPEHSAQHEWVYNHPQIDQSRVVWARSISALRDAELRAYYADRRCWRLLVNDLEARLRPLD